MEVDKSFFPLRGKFYNFRLLVSCLKYDGKGLSKSVILGYPTVSYLLLLVLISREWDRGRERRSRGEYRDYDRNRRERFSPPRHELSPPQKRMRRDW